MFMDEHLARGWQALLGAIRRVLRWTAGILVRPGIQSSFLPEPAAAASGWSWRSVVAAILSAGLCFALLGRMAEVGLQRGMDGQMYEAIDDAGRALAIAISDMRFGLNRGYVGYRAVAEAMEAKGLTKRQDILQKYGFRYPDVLKDRAQMNSAIQSALNANVPTDVGFGDRSMLSMETAELGLVDYMKLAFRLFGFRVESMFYLYFSLFGVSILAFTLAHWRSIEALALSILFLAAGNIVFDTGLFDHINLQTVANPRFLSTLGLLPGLHIILLMLKPRPASLMQMALACIQAVIFEFALNIRASLLWLVLFVLALAVIQIAIWSARRARADRATDRSKETTPGRQIALRLWPALTLLVGVWTYQSVIAMKMHPSYELDDFVPYHERFHNAFIGLTVHPQWQTLFGNDYHGMLGDRLGYLAGGLYLMDNYDVPESYVISPLSNTYKMRLDDLMTRDAYFQFVRRHPLFTIEAHFFKVAYLVSILTSEIRRAVGNPTILTIGLGALTISILLGYWSWRGGTTASPRFATWPVAVVSLFLMTFSWIPFIYALPYPYGIADALWMACFLLLILPWAIVTTAFRRAVKAVPEAAETGAS
jgi:hypothetical protein